MSMDVSQSILSDITVFNKYSKFVPEAQRRETWEELCERNMAMHIRKLPQIKEDIKEIYKKFVMTKKVLPSMRSMQFGGRPIELSNNRMFNCAYLSVSEPDAFWETMFLLLGGSGVGFSVQKHHVDQLPIVLCPPKDKQRRFLIGDSIEGWADAVKVLVRAYFEGRPDPIFDFRDIRPKGAKLITSGGKAPGPDPLRICLDHIRSVMNNACNRKMTTVECHDIMCHIADAVLSGGIRRAALISLFSIDDDDMMSVKTGSWWEQDPQRGRANNSVVLDRKTVTEEQFKKIWERVELSGCGEPGFFWTNDTNLGTNPCAEISLRDCQFCNLTEVNVSDVESQEDLNDRVRAASILGTIQATYTDFHYLRHRWKMNTEKDALLGVGMTGIASGAVLKLDLDDAAQIAKDVNKEFAEKLGINVAARVTTVKPSGCVTLDTEIKTSMGYGMSMEEIFKSQGYDREFLESLPNGTWLEIKPEMKELPHVLDENNDPQTITKLYVNGIQEVFEIEFEDGKSYKFTGNHRLKTISGWKRVDELTESDEIVSF